MKHRNYTTTARYGVPCRTRTAMIDHCSHVRFALALLLGLAAGVMTMPQHAKGQIIPLQPRTGGPTKTVFGYLPYWNKNTTLRYDLLTHVAHFSVGANSNGTLSNSQNWPWTTQINAAHQAGVKVILTVTQFTPSSTLTLITTPSYKNAFFTNIKNLMVSGKADGLNIDFEGSGSYTSYINQFMADLTSYLHAQIPGCEVTFAGPVINWGGWDLTGLANSCDGIFIMGYAFYGSWSTTSGPNSPLTGGTYNLTYSIYTPNTQYGTVQQNNPEKLILGIPYYGHHWKTATSDPRSSVISNGFVGSVTYSVAQAYADSYGVLWETSSQTPWCRWHDGTNWHQVWYDNADSLRLKYQLANDAGLQGVGMWCLGNDSGRTELWDLLEEMYIISCEITQHPVDQAACRGGSAQFTVAATGNGTLTYQWQKNGTNLTNGGHYSGVTTTILTVSSADRNDAASYQCVVTGGSTSVTSNAATLTIRNATAVTLNPAATSVCPGSTAQFTITATGDGTMGYQWQKDGIDLSNSGHYSGVTTATLTVSSASSADVASYRCVVTAGCGSATSTAAALTIKTETNITQHPANQSISAGETAQFSVSATGDGTLIYRWQKNNADLSDGGHVSGTTTSVLTITSANANDAGDYRCVVTAACGAAISNAADLTVTGPSCNTPKMDANGDQHVDAADFDTFSACYNGPTNPVSGDCLCMDANGDQYVDATDFDTFSACYNGPTNPPGCN